MSIVVCFWCCVLCNVFFFRAEDGIRDLVQSRGLGDVYKRQRVGRCLHYRHHRGIGVARLGVAHVGAAPWDSSSSVSYTHLTLPTIYPV